MFTFIKSKIQISKPTKIQLLHDLWLISVAFISTFFASWDGSFTKTSIKAGAVAGVSAVISIARSIVTTL
jgi:hypothetical protein